MYESYKGFDCKDVLMYAVIHFYALWVGGLSPAPSDAVMSSVLHWRGAP